MLEAAFQNYPMQGESEIDSKAQENGELGNRERGLIRAYTVDAVMQSQVVML